MGLTYLGSALLGLVLKNLVGRRLLILASQLGMAVSHLGLGLYFHFYSNCGSNTKPDPLSEGGRNQTHFNTNEEEEEALLGAGCHIFWLPLPLILGKKETEAVRIGAWLCLF